MELFSIEQEAVSIRWQKHIPKSFKHPASRHNPFSALIVMKNVQNTRVSVQRAAVVCRDKNSDFAVKTTVAEPNC